MSRGLSQTENVLSTSSPPLFLSRLAAPIAPASPFLINRPLLPLSRLSSQPLPLRTAWSQQSDPPCADTAVAKMLSTPHRLVSAK